MPKFTCNVRGCNNRFYRRLPSNVSLYILPQDAPKNLKEAWKKVCSGRLVACSEHFDKSDFIVAPDPRRHTGSPNGKTGHIQRKPLKHNGKNFVVKKVPEVLLNSFFFV